MANPNPLNIKDTSVFDSRGGAPYGICATLDSYHGSGIYSLDIDADRAWTLAHDGLDHNGNADTNAVLFSISGIGVLQNTANNESSLGKLRLISTRSITIGPGVSTIHFKSVVGGPQFAVVGSEKFNGRF